MAIIRLYNDVEGKSIVVDTPQALRMNLDLAHRYNLKFEITHGIEYSWVRQSIANFRQATNQYEEIV